MARRVLLSKRLKGKVHKWLVAAIVLLLVLGCVALIKAGSGSATSGSTVQADVKVGGGYGGGRGRKKEKEKDKEDKEKDSEQSSVGIAYGLAGGPGACSE